MTRGIDLSILSQITYASEGVMTKLKTIGVLLTEEQVKELQRLTSKVKQSDRRGRQGAIFAQVYTEVGEPQLAAAFLPKRVSDEIAAVLKKHGLLDLP